MSTPATMMKEIASATRILEAVWAMSLKDGVTTAFLEVRDNAPGETTIRGNCDGLVALALDVLHVAASGTEGHHAHIDEAGMADHCDRNLAIVYATSPWATEPTDAG